MKTKKTVKLSLNKVTVSNLEMLHMRGVRGGLAAQDTEPQAASKDWTNCDLCTIPYTPCSAMTMDEKSCAAPSCEGSCVPTYCPTCAQPLIACAVNDDVNMA